MIAERLNTGLGLCTALMKRFGNGFDARIAAGGGIHVVAPDDLDAYDMAMSRPEEPPCPTMTACANI